MSVHKPKQLRSACDRCYELKARCVRASITAPCGRCNRLSLVCSTARPFRPAGRRTHDVARSVPSGPSSRSRARADPNPRDIINLLDNVPDLMPDQKELLLFLLDRPENLDCYVVCPSFQVAEQQSLVDQLPAALPVLKDSYLACAGALKRIQSGTEIDSNNVISIQHASFAMGILRSLPVKNPQDAALCLTLGMMLALSVYSTVGMGLADICHYCLSTTYPFVTDAESNATLETRQGLLALLEIGDCLAFRRKPTLKVQPSSTKGVDRYLGLCSPILPYYYDLCVISHSLANTTNKEALARLFRQLDEIQTSLEEWQPTSLDDHFVNQFESADIVNLLAQAKVYRLAALLVGHRLRYQFGEKDGQADVWSNEIMMELNMAQRITKRPICFVTLPFLVAAVELRDPSSRGKALYQVDDFIDNITPILRKTARTFLTRVWQERDSKVTFFWFESIHKPCVVMDSIDPACLV